MNQDWLVKLSVAFARDPDEAEDAITNAYVRLHFLPWDLEGERKITLFRRDDFEIAAIERRHEYEDRASSFRLEIRDLSYGQIIANRPCDDLEHAVELYLQLQAALTGAFGCSDGHDETSQAAETSPTGRPEISKLSGD